MEANERESDAWLRPRSRGRSGSVRDNQSDAVPRQERERFGREPALVAKLDGVAEIGREPVQCLREALVAPGECWRQLPEQRSQLAGVGHRRESFQQEREMNLDVPQAGYVGQVATHLHREHEVRRGLLDPARHRLFAR